MEGTRAKYATRARSKLRETLQGYIYMDREGPPANDGRDLDE